VAEKKKRKMTGGDIMRERERERELCLRDREREPLGK
jgi:hypothetical protein